MMINSYTQSLCPVCLKRIPAERVIRDNTVYLDKVCAEHGACSTKIWQGCQEYSRWPSTVKSNPVALGTFSAKQGCPFDCGICVDHKRPACTVILEITQRCNLKCQVCFANAGIKSGNDPTIEQINQWYETVTAVNHHNCVVQLSGGEPTLRDDLPEIVRAGIKNKFDFLQLNTNGIKLAQEQDLAKKLAEAGLSSVYLQFDGTLDEINQQVRGRNLFAIKQAAIQACADNNLGVILVPTLVPGINVDNIGEMIKFALNNTPVVRGIHFQPISYFGRFPSQPRDADRLTLPELMQEIEMQTSGKFLMSHFQPPGWENAYCSFHCNYIAFKDGSVMPLSSKKKTDSCCLVSDQTKLKTSNAVDFISRQWKAPEKSSYTTKDGCCNTSPKNANDSVDEIMDLDEFLALSRNNAFSVSAMAFQDVWNLEIERVKECCIHVMSPDNRLIPFCLYNLTSTSGQHLYRQTV
jgi:7,8-dihydro-6-hydroxymethylpterin dimethyltransferase